MANIFRDLTLQDVEGSERNSEAQQLEAVPVGSKGCIENREELRDKVRVDLKRAEGDVKISAF